MIADAEMLRQLEETNPATVEYEALIRRNVELKARVVEMDEHERTGGRALLNFGHTIGHGIERAANYHGIAHGEAVSLGIAGACAISINTLRSFSDELCTAIRRHSATCCRRWTGRSAGRARSRWSGRAWTTSSAWCARDCARA